MGSHNANMETEDLLVIIKSNEASAGGTSDLSVARKEGQKSRIQHISKSRDIISSGQGLQVHSSRTRAFEHLFLRQ